MLLAGKIFLKTFLNQVFIHSRLFENVVNIFIRFQDRDYSGDVIKNKVRININTKYLKTNTLAKYL